MKVQLGATGVLAVAAVGVVGLVWWNRRAIGAAVATAGQAVNPVSDQNLAYRGTNAVGAALTGSADFSLGSWLYEKLNPAAVEAERRALAPVPVRTLPTTGDFARMDRASGTYYGPPEPVRYAPGEWDFGGSFGYGSP